MGYYYLPRVAEDTQGEPSTTIAICGQETPYNWVISPTIKTNNFFYGLTEKPLPSNTEYFNFSPVTNTPDNDENWNPSIDGEGHKEYPDYHIWRYTTENTIPGVSAQKHGVSTGVLFRGKISAKPNTRLATAMQADEKEVKHPIYAYQGVMYGNLEQLKDYVATYPQSALAIDFQETFLNQGKEEAEKIDLGTLTTKEAVENAIKNVNDLTASTDVFNMYTPDDNGNYYVYYYYFNRHNDNSNNTIMGPMEFATVRNNVYKLKISNIYNWGTPGDKPTDPDDPDESAKTYFKVTVEVLPWVVRINNIEF